MVHKDHGLLVFVDVSPTEQLDLKNNTKICFTSVVCDSEEGLPGLHQFKVGKWKQKLKRAKQLKQAIRFDQISIHAYGLTARQETIVKWSTDILNQSTAKIGANWNEDASTYSWNGRIYPRSIALGIAAYACVLPIFGLNVSYWLKNMSENKATIILDNLPLGSASGMDLLNALSINSSCKDLWKQNRQISNAVFHFTNMESFTTKEGKTFSAKKHPNFIIADWLAASLRANHDPSEFIGKKYPHPSSEIAIVGQVWKELSKKGRAIERDLDDPELIKKVSAFISDNT